jgi:hypothetical protein
MQVLARGLPRQHAGEGRDLSAEIGPSISAAGRLSCRFGFPHWFLVDVHATAFCIAPGRRARAAHRKPWRPGPSEHGDN